MMSPGPKFSEIARSAVRNDWESVERVAAGPGEECQYARTLLARREFLAGDYLQSVRGLRSVLRVARHPHTRSDAGMLMGLSLQSLGSYRSAESALRRAVQDARSDVDRSNALNCLAAFLWTSFRFVSARGTYRESERVADAGDLDTKPLALVGQARCSFELGDRQVLQDLERAEAAVVAAAPFTQAQVGPHLWLVRGMILSDLDRIAEAEQAWKGQPELRLRCLEARGRLTADRAIAHEMADLAARIGNQLWIDRSHWLDAILGGSPDPMDIRDPAIRITTCLVLPDSPQIAETIRASMSDISDDASQELLLHG